MTTINLNEAERLRLNVIFLSAAVEILGETQTQSLLGEGYGPAISIENLHQRLETVYGSSATRGIEHRIGQACFRYFIQRMGSELGFFQSTYKLFPTRQKVLTGFDMISGLFERVSREKIHFVEEESGYLLEIGSDNTPRQPKPLLGCEITTGFIKEFMSWAGNGKIYEVVEGECRNKRHDHCIYHISKVPLD